MDLLEKVIHLDPEVSFLETVGGIKVYNKTGSFILKGQASYSIMRWLVEKLDGKRPVKDFLPHDEIGNRIALIINALLKYQFANIVTLPATKQEQEILERSPELHQFLACHVKNPLNYLIQFSYHPLVCIGNGMCLNNLILALLEHGATHITVIAPKSDHAQIAHIFNGFQQHDPEVKYQLLLEKNNQQYSLEDKAIILMANDRPSDLIAHLHVSALMVPMDNKICGIINFQQDKHCYRCMKQQFLNNSKNDSFRIAPAAATIAAQYIVLALLCHLTGISHKLSHNVLWIDQDSLKTEKKHAILQCQCGHVFVAC